MFIYILLFYFLIIFIILFPGTSVCTNVVVLRSLFIYFQFRDGVSELYPKDVAGLYFPTFLFRVVLFTLMFITSLMALTILYPSLTYNLKVVHRCCVASVVLVFKNR